GYFTCGLATDNERGLSVDHAVIDPPRGVEVDMSPRQDATRQTPFEVVDYRRSDHADLTDGRIRFELFLLSLHRRTQGVTPMRLRRQRIASFVGLQTSARALAVQICRFRVTKPRNFSPSSFLVTLGWISVIQSSFRENDSRAW